MYHGDNPNSATYTLGDQDITGSALKNAVYDTSAISTDSISSMATITHAGMVTSVDSSAWTETAPDMSISNEGNLVFKTETEDITLTPQILKRLIEIVKKEFPEDNL